MIIALASMAAVTTVAAAIDVRTRRIPNVLCALLALVALGVHAVNGPGAALFAAGIMLATIAVGLPAFVRGWFGAGDLKLFAACAGVVGLSDLPAFAADVFIAGGILCLAEALRRGRLRAVLASTLRTGAGLGPSENIRVPYGVAIAAAALYYTLHLFALTSPRLS